MHGDQWISYGYDAGNYANAYETTNLEVALEELEDDLGEVEELEYDLGEDVPVRGRWDITRNAFILGFYASYALDEIPLTYRDVFDEAYWSDAGQRAIKLGYADPRDDDYETEANQWR